MSLQLDGRQRAMLAEMKVPFWWPQADPIAEVVEPKTDARAPASTAARMAPSITDAHAPAGVAADAGIGMAPPRGQDGDFARHVEGGIDTMDWAALRETVLACTACALCEGRKAPVFPIATLPAQADWLIVGEPPDEHEERAGAPFVGNAGLLLDNMLRAVQCTRDGQGRHGARLTSVVKCRPGVARNPSADELAQCAVYLRREIALTQPRVIVAMGRFAAVALLGAEHPSVLQSPFGQVRGKLYRSGGIPVVVTYHPAKLLRAPLEKAAAWADLCLARAQVLLPPPPSAP